ncbi:diguanylate cyclase [Sulfurimonas sp. C5]|nr:diguanylate cyclase [Sulfurimonas sp. C5]
MKELDTKNFLQHKTKELNIQVETGKHYLNLLAEVLHTNVLNNSINADIMYEASNTNDLKKQAQLRAKLYQTYIKEYEYMKTLGVRQLHFHLPGVVSFLRFHKPEKFGDSLASVRESIMYVNQYKKPIECFEEGRIFNGFRHVYPIFKDNKFVGTVEISYSFRAFLEHMLEINTKASYLFMINNHVIDTKVFKDEKNHYMKTVFGQYSIDKTILSNSMGIPLDDILAINKKISSVVSEKLKTEDNFAVNTFLDSAPNKNLIVTFLAVRNFEKKKVAYIVGYNYNTTLDLLQKRNAQVFVLLSILNFMVMLLFFTLFRKETKKVEIASQEAIKDPLTGILNRRGFDNLLCYKMSVSRRYNSALSVIFFDIDDFKKINDSFGHDIGDIVLQELSGLIRAHIRESDVFARWGGEEFIILLPKTSVKDAETLAGKLKHEVNQYNFNTVNVLTCSFGVTQLQDHETAEQLIKRVDELLYIAKTTGKNKIVSDT